MRVTTRKEKERGGGMARSAGQGGAQGGGEEGGIMRGREGKVEVQV